MGVPGDPRIIKMVTQGTKIHPKDVKMEPPGLPNHWYASPASHQLTGYQDAPGYQKKTLQVCHLASLGTQNHPFQHSASPASPANPARPARNKQQATSNQPANTCCQKGAGGRGEALKSAAARSNLRANAGVLDIRCSGPTTDSSDS